MLSVRNPPLQAEAKPTHSPPHHKIFLVKRRPWTLLVVTTQQLWELVHLGTVELHNVVSRVVPLRTVKADRITKEFVKVFTRIGVPDEILTDQGTNFTLQLLQEVYHLLKVKPICTMSYHPQTNGLVERFNNTLKSMLRKAAIAEGKNWDNLLPYLIVAD